MTTKKSPTKSTGVAVPITVPPEQKLEAIAEDIRAEFGKGIDSAFAVGRLLVQARAEFPDNIGFGKWLDAADLPFGQRMAHRFRWAAENEELVRAAIVQTGQSGRDPSVTGIVQRLQAGPKAEAEPTPRERDEVGDDRDFMSLRSGIHGLLGWTVSEDGEGEATKNGLLQLPNDQLIELKNLVEALAKAFGEAVHARRTS